MTYRLIYLGSAKADLDAIYDWIADRADPDTADQYVKRLEVACEKLTDFPKRGTPRDDLAPGLRTVAFKRQATIVFEIEGSKVLVRRIMHRGRDVREAITLE